MHRCISFKFWSSVLSKPFVWFFLERSSGSLSIPRDKRSSSGHLCSYMTRANGQSGPRAPEQMFTSVSLCKRKLMEPQIKSLMKTLLLLIWRGVPEGWGDSWSYTSGCWVNLQKLCPWTDLGFSSTILFSISHLSHRPLRCLLVPVLFIYWLLTLLYSGIYPGLGSPMIC